MEKTFTSDNYIKLFGNYTPNDIPKIDKLWKDIINNTFDKLETINQGAMCSEKGNQMLFEAMALYYTCRKSSKLKSFVSLSDTSDDIRIDLQKSGIASNEINNYLSKWKQNFVRYAVKTLETELKVKFTIGQSHVMECFFTCAPETDWTFACDFLKLL